jgi:hypothetical protein
MGLPRNCAAAEKRGPKTIEMPHEGRAISLSTAFGPHLEDYSHRIPSSVIVVADMIADSVARTQNCQKIPLTLIDRVVAPGLRHSERTGFAVFQANNKPPATRAARLSASSCPAVARNLHSTTTAEKSSMALSPPNARRAGLRARQAEKRDTTASTLIHAIVTVCTRWIRRIASGVAIWLAEAIRGTIIA